MPRLPPTERAHPRSRGLEALPLRRLLSVLHESDREATRAVGHAVPALARLCRLAGRSLAAGGRVAYIGAGTSGRLGALDAAEWRPTFGLASHRVLALVAGGDPALSHAVEGAEDDASAGRAAVRRARLGSADLAIGISASGMTPFVLAALAEARRRGATTSLITSNPSPKAEGVLRVVLATGPELVAGSTRMKAGSATKMALSLFSTAVMVRAGHVRQGGMIDLVASSDKLRRRAIRLVSELGRVSPSQAEAALLNCGWRVRAAIEEVEKLARQRGKHS
ncbi:MAG TPA: N-acetylmuramic acid 6-phosphate etherase [Anaeromyxobacteraceae bacterium]|nr:N-acetylmuramic acid 6-phosphate etherase [Anaeromyxobacteraceae bacterium]